MYWKPAGPGMAAAGGTLAYTGMHMSIALIGIVAIVVGLAFVRIATLKRRAKKSVNP